MNKISHYIKIFFLVFIFSIYGCEQEFLETSPTTDISDQDVFQTTQGAQTVMNGIYRFLREYDSGGSDRHEDMGQKSVDITLDVLDGRDIIIPFPAWYYFDHDMGFDYTEARYAKVHALWRFYYRLINNANSIINNIDGATGSNADKNRLKGEAMAIRAHSYFYLINLYQKAYTVDPTLPGVPLYEEAATGLSVGNPRGTVQDVYNFIIDDLTEALELLPADGARKNKSHVNINVTNGMLARAYLFMEDWQNAADHANLAREGYPLMSQADYVAGFNDYNNEEWIWGLPFNQDQQHYYYSFFSMFDLERAAGYWNMRMNDDFLSNFSETDIRANQAVGDNLPLVVDKLNPPINATEYITPADKYVIRKFRDTPNQTGHYVLMRSAEMILIEAEAKARQEQFTEAQNLLFLIQSRADENAGKSTNTGKDLIDEIILERRKELYGEGLASTLDVKRLRIPIERTGTHQFPGSLPADSWRLVWQIPRDEIDANDNISTQDQNPLQ